MDIVNLLEEVILRKDILVAHQLEEIKISIA